MSSSWPVGVTTEEDMHRYAETLFGNCEIDNLLTGMPPLVPYTLGGISQVVACKRMTTCDGANNSLQAAADTC